MMVLRRLPALHWSFHRQTSLKHIVPNLEEDSLLLSKVDGLSTSRSTTIFSDRCSQDLSVAYDNGVDIVRSEMSIFSTARTQEIVRFAAG